MVRRAFWLAVVVVVALVVSPWGQAADSPEWAGTWQSGPATGFTLTRLDGAYVPSTGLVYFLGGRQGTPTVGDIWSFNPATSAWADTGVDMPVPISNYTVNVLTDATGTGLYTFCGRNSAAGQNLSVQVYYPGTNSVVQLPAGDNYPGAVSCTSALNVVVGNKVYLAGGFDGTNTNVQTWVFDPMAASGSRWTRLTSADLAQGLAYIMGAAVDGKVYAVGGAWFDGASLVNVATVQVLDPAAATPTWTAVASLPEVCSSSRAWGFDTSSPYDDPVDGTPLAGKIVSGCGVWSVENERVYAYSVASNTWEAFPSFLIPHRDMAAELVPLAGSPALWIWGGRSGVDDPPVTTSEYYSLGLVPVELQSFSVE